MIKLDQLGELRAALRETVRDAFEERVLGVGDWPTQGIGEELLDDAKVEPFVLLDQRRHLTSIGKRLWPSMS